MLIESIIFFNSKKQYLKKIKPQITLSKAYLARSYPSNRNSKTTKSEEMTTSKTASKNCSTTDPFPEKKAMQSSIFITRPKMKNQSTGKA